MNIQAMMKQAQKLQTEMMNEKSKIDAMEFEGKSSLVTVTMTGNKQVKKVNLNIDEIDADEKDMLEDMVMLAVNDALKKIDQETEQRMGKYTKGMPGLF